ncbi:MAG: 30S ribosomal protein S18 [Parcubacteria group bacterium GW2011_GWA2_31_28]|nr:MAG: 30S ribosomal protein S18 [Parcubacteria group bacterium GW2011_GWA2_31_28]
MEKKDCLICKNNIQEIDYKDTRLLRKFITAQAKIANRKRTGACAWHQRKLARVIKRSRTMGLLPFTTRTINNLQD